MKCMFQSISNFKIYFFLVCMCGYYLKAIVSFAPSPSSPIKRIIWCFTHSGSFLKWLLGASFVYEEWMVELWWELCFCCSALCWPSLTEIHIHHHLPYPLRESMRCMWSLRCLPATLWCGTPESPQLSPCHSLVRSSGMSSVSETVGHSLGSWRAENMFLTPFSAICPCYI